MLKQVERWATRRRQGGSEGVSVELDAMQKEVITLKKQEDRYAKAYAEGLFSMGRLQEYLTPVREKIASLEEQIASARAAREELREAALLEPAEIEAFAESAARVLQHLNFEAKRAIVINVID